MTRRPLSVSAALVFVLLNALIWLVFGIILAANAHPALPVPLLIKGAMAFLSFAAAIIFVALFFVLLKRNRVAYYLALAFFIAISVLTIFDDFGLVDLMVLAINVAPVILLIMGRTWYLKGKPGNVENI